MGFSDLALKYEEQIIFQLRELYQQYGYQQYRMSKFEEYELYARNKNFLVSEHVLTFTDTDGKLLALKPDVTLSIIKNSQDTGEALQKVYYNENVYRTAPDAGYREIMQVGLECIGPLDDYAVGEVVLLAARSLETISTDYLLDLSHMGFVAGLLDQLGWEDREEVLARMGEKNLPAVTALCRDQGMDSALSADLCRLTELYGPPDQVLPVLREMVRGEQMAEALEQLEAVCGMLDLYRENLRLDFSIVNDMSYYNGIIFRGYLPGIPTGVLAGGRYDKLLHRMGKGGGAIGFAVYMDLLERIGVQEKEYDVDVLLLYRDGADAARVSAKAEALRRSGKSVRVEREMPPMLRCRETREV